MNIQEPTQLFAYMSSVHMCDMRTVNITLILFSVWRTDRSNTRFATVSSGKTDNARRRQAAEILPPSLLGAELV